MTYVHHSNNVLCVDMYVRMYVMYCVWIRTYVMYCIMFLRNVVCVDVHTYVMYCIMFVRNVVCVDMYVLDRMKPVSDTANTSRDWGILATVYQLYTVQ